MGPYPPVPPDVHQHFVRIRRFRLDRAHRPVFNVDVSPLPIPNSHPVTQGVLGEQRPHGVVNVGQSNIGGPLPPPAPQPLGGPVGPPVEGRPPLRGPMPPLRRYR